MNKKRYIVIIQDEWNNLYLMGDNYNSLKDAIPEINEWLKPYNTSIDSLEEYLSTFGMVFDKEIETPNEEIIMVRGFIIDG